MDQAATDYSRAKATIQGGSLADRAALASDPAMLPEVLYFLSADPVPEIRRTVAENRATPAQADSRLARDTDVAVRCALARKLVGEGLAEGERRALWRMGFTILETLACDRMVRVRRILAEAFATPTDAPRAIVVGLARDRARAVAQPVLKASPVLTDADMVTIIGAGAPDWAQAAIAGGATTSAAVAEALAAAGSIPAVARLIGNTNARIDEPTMERIVDRAADIAAWQAPLVARPKLSQGIMLRMARVLAQPLLASLRARADLAPQTAAGIDRAIETRATEPPARAAHGRTPGESPAQRARRLHDAGELSETILALALDNGERSFVTVALALRAGLPVERVRRMVSVRSGRTMMALAWKAGLGARFAMDLQRRLAHIVPPFIVNARDGIDFPLDPAEMTAQLALFED